MQMDALADDMLSGSQVTQMSFDQECGAPGVIINIMPQSGVQTAVPVGHSALAAAPCAARAGQRGMRKGSSALGMAVGAND